MDRVLIEPTESYVNRVKSPTNDYGKVIDGVRIRSEVKLDEIKGKVRPDNVVMFLTAGAARDNSIKHPAPFHKDLPKYYINLLTDDGDTILDIFGGIMTTGLACNEIGNRNFIGIEKDFNYFDVSKKRVEKKRKEKDLQAETLFGTLM